MSVEAETSEVAQLREVLRLIGELCSWLAKSPVSSTPVGPVVAPSQRGATYTCIYEKCASQHLQLDPSAAERWMDEHVREVAHDRRWPVTFRIDYPHTSLPATSYRDPVRLLEERS